MLMSRDLLEAYLKERMKPSRLAHACRVAETARHLAEEFGADPEKAEIAGLLHDIARDDGEALLLQKSREFGIVVDEIGQSWPVLLHGPVAAKEVQQRLGITDEEVLSAIARHTTGSPRMSTLDAVVFLADFIEPGRTFPEVAVVRRIVEEEGLFPAVVQTAVFTMIYLLERHHVVHPDMLGMYNYYWLKRRDEHRG